MARPKSPGWKPVTMMLSADVIEGLREKAHEQRTTMGKVANQLLQPALGIKTTEDHSELFKRLDRAIRHHWGSRGNFDDLLKTLDGAPFDRALYGKWKVDGSIPPAFLPMVLMVLTVVESFPAAR